VASFVPTSEETLEDQRRYTSARMTEVACLDCLATVGVKKNSEHHTSIQWSDEAVRACPEFTRMTGSPDGRPLYRSCPRMATSIDAAARDGVLPIGAEDGY
jgi:hypothetical protein